MDKFSIRVERIGKKYRIGRKKSGELRESFSNFLNYLKPTTNNNHATTNEFWALKEIDFEVKKGEALGIIGQNGAGKSTILKILSRITKPTKGRFEINGRVSSLLEVGTGFHPELTGRENIYLNGTILGMRRAEIKAKFDEIIAFSGVEEFIETPVKHYSSGMKVRLAFSVAAHLEPEILIIDEVLAVGDSTFQNRCIEKMTDVIQSGRTVLFVSHNMQAIKSLCPRSILLEKGEKIFDDISENTINKYLYHAYNQKTTRFNFNHLKDRKGVGNIIFREVELNKSSLEPGDEFQIKVKLERKVEKSFKDLLFGINIKDNYGNEVVHLSNMFINKINIDHYSDDSFYTFKIISLNIKPGKYHISIFLRADEEVQDWILNQIHFEIVDGNIYNFANSKMITGMIQPKFEFHEEIS